MNSPTEHTTGTDESPSDNPVDTSNAWSIEEETGDTGRVMITATHDDDDVSVVAKEHPNGAELRLQTPANLPGGYDVVHNSEYLDRANDNAFATATSELERFTAMYDSEGTWIVDGTPVLQ